MKNQARIWPVLLALLILCSASIAEVYGPVHSYEELLALVEAAEPGDVFMVSGHIDARGKPPMTTTGGDPIIILSDGSENTEISGLNLSNANVTFSDLRMTHGLNVSGESTVELRSNVTVDGSEGGSAVSFDGSGALLVSPGCRITGGDGATGVTISNPHGMFYAGLEGEISGGVQGGTGVLISPLSREGILMLGGKVRGGDSSEVGGSAATLHDVEGYVTVDGHLTGGSGSVGGIGMQLVSLHGQASIGVFGTLSGGDGVSFGGDGLQVIDAHDASEVVLQGTSLQGGNATNSIGRGGQSLNMVGDGGLMHTSLLDCNLADGRVAPPPVNPPDVPLPGTVLASSDAGPSLPPVTSPDAAAVPAVLPANAVPAAAPSADRMPPDPAPQMQGMPASVPVEVPPVPQQVGETFPSVQEAQLPVSPLPDSPGLSAPVQQAEPLPEAPKVPSYDSQPETPPAGNPAPPLAPLPEHITDESAVPEETIPGESQGNEAAPGENHGNDAAPGESQGSEAAPQENHGSDAAPQENHSSSADSAESRSEAAAPEEDAENPPSEDSPQPTDSDEHNAGDAKDAVPPAAHPKKTSHP